jgi:hypothetical protein
VLKVHHAGASLVFTVKPCGEEGRKEGSRRKGETRERGERREGNEGKRGKRKRRKGRKGRKG